MIDSDRKRFAETLAGVYELYGKPLSETVLRVWWEAMKSVDFSVFSAALSRHAANPDVGSFVPKPADVIREIVGTRTDVALLAWTKTLDAVRRVGAWDSVVFDDPVIHRVVEDLGGWPFLCSVDERELPFVEKRFRDAYRAYASRGSLDSFSPRLLGRFDAENSAKGYPLAEPRLVGARAAALAVLGSGEEPKAIRSDR